MMFLLICRCFLKIVLLELGTMDAIDIYGSREFTGWEVYGIIELFLKVRNFL